MYCLYRIAIALVGVESEDDREESDQLEQNHTGKLLHKNRFIFANYFQLRLTLPLIVN